MSEQQFNARLDELLRTGSTDMSGTDHDFLAVGALLAKIDFSTDSRIRESQRAKLLCTPKPVTVRRFAVFRAAATIAAALGLLIVMTLTIPPLRVAAQELIDWVGQMVFAHEPTRAQLLDGQPVPTPEGVSREDAALPFGIDDIETLSRQVGFAVYVPDYVPESYGLLMRYAPTTGDGAEVAADYTDSAAANADVLHISQVKVSTDLSDSVWAIGDAPVETVTLRGVTGTFVEQAPIGVRPGVDGRRETYGVNILTWREGDFRFIVQSSRLSRSELMRVAESLQGS